MCERIVMPDGSVAIVCGHGVRHICDVCDKPVRKNGRGFQAFVFHGKKVDLCDACFDRRAEGDPEWRRFAERAIARSLGIVLVD